MLDSVKEPVLNACVCEECAPSISVSRLFGCSDFVDLFISVDDADSDNIQEGIFLRRFFYM